MVSGAGRAEGVGNEDSNLQVPLQRLLIAIPCTSDSRCSFRQLAPACSILHLSAPQLLPAQSLTASVARTRALLPDAYRHLRSRACTE